MFLGMSRIWPLEDVHVTYVTYYSVIESYSSIDRPTTISFCLGNTPLFAGPGGDPVSINTFWWWDVFSTNHLSQLLLHRFFGCFFWDVAFTFVKSEGTSNVLSSWIAVGLCPRSVTSHWLFISYLQKTTST